MFNAYVYLIKNKITNQYYYGSRAGNIRNKLHPMDDLWKKYFTSSARVKKLIEKYGKDSFETKIIFEDKDYQKCYWVEQRLIKDNRKDPNNLNGTFVDPDTGTRMVSSYGETEASKKARIAKMQKSKKGKFNSNGHLGLKHSEETKRKMSESQQKLNYKHSDEVRKKMSDRAQECRAKMTKRQLEESFGHCKGKTWKLFNGKRVWFTKQEK